MDVVWERSWLTRALLVLLCVKVLIAVLAFDPLGLHFSQPKALFGAVLAPVVVALVGALAAQYGWSVLPRSPMHWPVAVFGAAYVVATLVSLDLRIALFGAPGRYLGLVATLDLLSIYAGVAIVGRFGWARLWLAGSCIAGVAGVTVYEALTVAGALPTITELSRASTIGNADPFGMLLGTVGAAAMGLASRASRALRWIALSAAGIALTGLFFVGTRAPIAGVAVVGLLLAAIWAAQASDWPRRVARAFILLGAAAVVATGIAATPLGERIGKGLSGVIGALQASPGPGQPFADRADLYRTALAEWWDRPLLGVGPDNYVVAFSSYRLPGTSRFHDSDLSQTSTHSWILKLATDSGLIGLIAFIAVVVVGLRLAMRNWRDPWVAAAASMLTAYLAAGAISIDNVATAWIPWLALGILAIRPTPQPSLGPRSGSRRRTGGLNHHLRPTALALLIVGAAIGAVGTALALGTLGAARDAQVMRAALALGDPARLSIAIAAGLRATHADPNRADYWSNLSDAYRRAGRHRDRVEAARRAADLAPYDSGVLGDHAVATAIVGQLGDSRALAEARTIGRQAVLIDRYRAFPHVALALAEYANMNWQVAADEMETARSLGEEAIPYYGHIAAARSYERMRRPADIVRWLEEVVAGLPASERVAAGLLLADALNELGRSQEALAEVDAVLKADSTNAEALELKRKLTSP